MELHKKNHKPRRLRGKHFNYLVVENTDLTKKPDLQVVLKQFVEGVGKKGEIVTVRPNFAYNKLLLTDLAAYATPENIEKYGVKEGEESEEEKHSSPYAQRVSFT